MRTRPRSEAVVGLTLLALAAAVALVMTTSRSGHATPSEAIPSASSWRGLVGSRPRVSVGQRVIVVLKFPSVADRVASFGGRATDVSERRWSEAALASQRLLISRLAIQGVAIRPEFSYTRVLNGFSAAVDPSAIPLLERDDAVAGVYPVRAAFPASVSSSVIAGSDFAPDEGHWPNIGLSDVDGRGVTVALLDTGVDRGVPFLRGRLDGGIDIVGGDRGAFAARKPDDQTQLERHGTEMAGLLVGAGGPSGLAGVATGATILPIRVAGWQQDASHHWAVYSRTDQILAGLERAVDPNGDGDAHDAARVALVALSEPYAAFADGPEARAAAGALALDTLVVAPAGNDGPAGPGYGSVGGPGGAPGVLSVGAIDTRALTKRVHVVIRSGLHVLVDRTLPLAGAVGPTRQLELMAAVPRGGSASGTGPGRLVVFFGKSGRSLVAGRAALVAGGSSPSPSVENAAEAGAAAVLLYGSRAAPGGLGLDEDAGVPVVPLEAPAAQAIASGLARGRHVAVTIGAAQTTPNTDLAHVAAFSSTGLAYDGSVKPELVAPGVALATSDPGENADGSARYATVNGSSAAAAATAGAAALLAQARPGLDAPSLKGLLVGTAKPLAGNGVTEQGAGMVDVGAAAAGEIAAEPDALALGRSTGAGWKTKQTFLLRNVSTRTLRVQLGLDLTAEGATTVDFSITPSTLVLRRGYTKTITVRAITASQPNGSTPAEGYVVARVVGGGGIHVPWTIAFGPANVELVHDVRLSARTFKPSDVAPALLQLDAGALVFDEGRQEVRPVSLLDVRLVNALGEDLGLLARLRDLLPGRYAFGITGRDPQGKVLPAGDYRLRLIAWPTDGGVPTRRQISFTIR
jgi:minor extracellular serine protease Vpr